MMSLPILYFQLLTPPLNFYLFALIFLITIVPIFFFFAHTSTFLLILPPCFTNEVAKHLQNCAKKSANSGRGKKRTCNTWSIRSSTDPVSVSIIIEPYVLSSFSGVFPDSSATDSATKQSICSLNKRFWYEAEEKKRENVYQRHHHCFSIHRLWAL